jgi:hypothetical protein
LTEPNRLLPGAVVLGGPPPKMEEPLLPWLPNIDIMAMQRYEQKTKVGEFEKACSFSRKGELEYFGRETR